MKNHMMSHDRTPVFDLTSFLAGRTHAHGVFEDRFGRTRRRFTVVLDGRWEGAWFRLTEEFLYDDGASETRIWRLRPGASGAFTATATDCIGVADGRSDRHGCQMRYRFRLRLGARSIAVDFVDRIMQVDRHLALNRATVSKWGVRLGEVFIVFERQAATRAATDEMHEPVAFERAMAAE